MPSSVLEDGIRTCRSVAEAGCSSSIPVSFYSRGMGK
jgi:hypothetical protein